MLCLKFGYSESFSYVIKDSALLHEVNDFIEECCNSSANKSPLCQCYSASLKNSKLPAHCKFNKLDAGHVPPVIKELTFMEKRFLTKVYVFMTVLSLPASGKFAKDGLCINFPVNFEEQFQNITYVPERESSSLIGKQLSQLPVVSLQLQKTKPANMFSGNEIEELAFPWLFPCGRSRLKTNRKPNILVLQYFQN